MTNAIKKNNNTNKKKNKQTNQLKRKKNNFKILK